MNGFEFEYPLAFALLPLAVCFYKCPVPVREIVFPHLHFFTRVTTWIDKEKLLHVLIFALMVISLASPIGYDAKLADTRKGRDLVFVLDTSGSMGQSGFSAEHSDASRFDVLRTLIGRFVEKRRDDNVGVVVFGTFAFAAVPLTYDMQAVGFLLDYLSVGIAGENTAIGDGLDEALRLLAYGQAKQKVIVLVTDGRQNRGRISIKSAVERAKRKGVRIYTVGIGTIRDFDAPLLKKIADETGGKTFAALNEADLDAVYKNLDALEPSPIRSESYLNKKLFFPVPLGIALLLLLYLLARRKEREWSL